MFERGNARDRSGGTQPVPRPPKVEDPAHAVRAALLKATDRYIDTLGPEAARRALIGIAVVVESLYPLEPMEDPIG